MKNHSYFRYQSSRCVHGVRPVLSEMGETQKRPILVLRSTSLKLFPPPVLLVAKVGLWAPVKHQYKGWVCRWASHQAEKKKQDQVVIFVNSVAQVITSRNSNGLVWHSIMHMTCAFFVRDMGATAMHWRLWAFLLQGRGTGFCDHRARWRVWEMC